MQYQALAADYDGTLATDGVVDEKTIEALHRLRESGRRLILVTGRIIEQLVQTFPQIKLCDLVVADNGALLYDPQTGQKIFAGRSAATRIHRRANAPRRAAH